MKDKKVEVKDIFPENYNCAQTVLRLILVDKDIYFPEVPWVAAGFGGGVSRNGEICGAVAGAIMAIGLLHSQTITDPAKHRNATYNSANLFLKKFKEKHKTPICNDLLGFDIQDKELRGKASEEGIFKEKCPIFVETAIEILQEIFTE